VDCGPLSDAELAHLAAVLQRHLAPSDPLSVLLRQRWGNLEREVPVLSAPLSHSLAESMHVSSLQYSSVLMSVDTDCSRVDMDCNTAQPDPPPYASVASAAQPSPSAFESDNRHASVSPMLHVARSRFCRAVPDSFCTHRRA
jgi:hypothetical protein